MIGEVKENARAGVEQRQFGVAYSAEQDNPISAEGACSVPGDGAVGNHVASHEYQRRSIAEQGGARHRREHCRKSLVRSRLTDEQHELIGNAAWHLHGRVR